MKNALVCALLLAGSGAATAQGQLLTILGDDAPPSSDVALAMMSGFVDCDPLVALPHALAASGARFAESGERVAPPDAHSGGGMVLQPNTSAKRGPRGAVRHLTAMYRLVPAVGWPNGIRVLRVGQTVDVAQVPGGKSAEAVTLTFNVPADVVRHELDKRFDGRVSALLGLAHRHQTVWFEQPAANALRCVHQPDM